MVKCYHFSVVVVYYLSVGGGIVKSSATGITPIADIIMKIVDNEVTRDTIAGNGTRTVCWCCLYATSF